MNSPEKFLHLIESKNKSLVPVIKGTPLHSLHNPQREAEVFASNHLAHLSKSSNVIVLGLGFGYHIEEMCKILQLKHKSFSLTVIEAHKELVTLWSSYQKNSAGVEVYSASTGKELYENKKICELLLNRPVVIIHQPSFEVAKNFYTEFLTKRACGDIVEFKVDHPWWDEWSKSQAGPAQQVMRSQSTHANWLKFFWELKHAE